MRRKLALVALVATAIVAGCSRPLATAPDAEVPPGAMVACAGVGLDAFLRGDPTDPSTAWLVQPDGGRQDVLFPAGFTAVFAPGLQILDPQGKVVMADGDYVYGACVGPGDKLTVAPEESLTLDCGPVQPNACRNNAPSVALGEQSRANRVVAGLRFTSADGDYVVAFEDGTTADGHADLGL